MLLSDAATFFHRAVATDAFTGLEVFKCRVRNPTYGLRDSGASYRRVVDVKVGTAMPVRMAVNILGRGWLLGVSEPDGLSAAHIESYVAQLAEYSAVLCNLSDAAEGLSTHSTICSVEWDRDFKAETEMSNPLQVYSILYAEVPGFEVGPGVLITTGVGTFLVVSENTVASGFNQARAIKVGSPERHISILYRRDYDVSRGEYQEAIVGTWGSILLRWQGLFKQASQKSVDFKEGDVQLVLPGAALALLTDVPREPVSVSRAGVNYQVLGVYEAGGAGVLHVRPKGAV